MNIFRPLYRFLISLQLAVTLILLLIVSLSAGTIIESLHGATTAKIIVYNSPWFGAILVLLALNVFTVAISRWPWKKKHIGFLLTHLGIICILVGSMITRYAMTDGQLVLIEGEKGGMVKLPEQVLQIRKLGESTTFTTPIPQKAFPWSGKEKMGNPGGLPVTFYLSHYYPKAMGKSVFQRADRGPGALQVRLKSSMMSQEMWLPEDVSGRSFSNLGPATIGFGKPIEAAQEKEPVADQVFLVFKFEEQMIRVDLDPNLQVPFETTLEGTPYKIVVDGLFRNAIVEDRFVVENKNALKPEAWGNPAVKLKLIKEGLEEKHHVFSNFPDFSSIHGHSGAQSGVKIIMHAPSAPEAQNEFELRFYKEEGELMYQARSGEEIVSGKAEVGKVTPMNWMSFSFEILEYFPHGERTVVYDPRANSSTAAGVTSALELTLQEGTSESKVWLSLEEIKQVKVGESFYQIFFGRKEKPLGFTLKLVDFEKKTYPGTSKAASFASDVQLIDPMRGVERDVNISMNEPLEYRGFKIYQSGYRERPGQPDISIFSAGHDPGIPLNYAGALIMVVGIVVMIVMQQQARRKRT